MHEFQKIAVFITTSSTNEAEKIVGRLLTERLIACANIIPQIESRYWWKGKIDTSNECMLIVKSDISKLSSIIELVKKTHSYEVPEIIALPIIGGNSEYLNWIEKEINGEQQIV